MGVGECLKKATLLSAKYAKRDLHLSALDAHWWCCGVQNHQETEHACLWWRTKRSSNSVNFWRLVIVLVKWCVSVILNNGYLTVVAETRKWKKSLDGAWAGVLPWVLLALTHTLYGHEALLTMSNYPAWSQRCTSSTIQILCSYLKNFFNIVCIPAK